MASLAQSECNQNVEPAQTLDDWQTWLVQIPEQFRRPIGSLTQSDFIVPRTADHEPDEEIIALFEGQS